MVHMDGYMDVSDQHSQKRHQYPKALGQSIQIPTFEIRVWNKSHGG